MAQLKSPEEFLGYPSGTRFIYHYQLVDYCKHVAVQRPQMVQWKSYGKTNKGRELGILTLTKFNLLGKSDEVQQVPQQELYKNVDYYVTYYNNKKHPTSGLKPNVADHTYYNQNLAC